MTHSKKPRIKGIGIAATAVLMGTGLTACGSNDDKSDEDAYCARQVDGQYIVADEDDCTRDPGSFFLYHSAFGRTYKPGQTLPGGGSAIRYNDSAGRSKLGLPKTGKISTGSGFGAKVSVSKGGGSGKGGGFGGGHGSGG